MQSQWITKNSLGKDYKNITSLMPKENLSQQFEISFNLKFDFKFTYKLKMVLFYFTSFLNISNIKTFDYKYWVE